MGALEPDPVLFNEYHALLVRLAKQRCAKTRYDCMQCPAEGFL
jgi:endonuclease-3 related protein